MIRALGVQAGPATIASWGVPVILASSGSMGNNGAVTAMTALPQTYANGAWLYLPAGAVAAGVPAAPAFYWFVGSTTQAGTVYNSTWDGLGVPSVGVTTAFATTGPGAFTGVATGEIVVATITVGAGAMGANGQLLIESFWNNNTAAGNKIFRVRFSGASGSQHFAQTVSTAASMIAQTTIANAGVATEQKGSSIYTQATASGAGMTLYGGNANTAAATTLVFSLEKATATNHAILENANVQLTFRA